MLKERFFNTFKFSNHANNMFILLLRKSVYPYEYMDDWKKFNKTSLPEKEDFSSHLNMEYVTGADSTHAKRVCKDFFKEFNCSSLLADVFENFICFLKYTNLILQNFFQLLVYHGKQL